MSFLRRFVYMVLEEGQPANDGRPFYSLRRINMSRLFSPSTAQLLPLTQTETGKNNNKSKSNNGGGFEEAPVLPPVCARFSTPSSKYESGKMAFMQLARDKVLATDMTGRTTIYDDGLSVVRSGPAFKKPPLDFPVAVPVANDLYVLDSGCYFQGFLHRNDLVYPKLLAYDKASLPEEVTYEDWRCQELPPLRGVTPPITSFTSYAVVAGNTIWLSIDRTGTFTFDIAQRAWAKRGKWMLPFSGLAEYLPEHKLWFGVSSDMDCGQPLCTFDMDNCPKPAVRNVWKQEVVRPSETTNWELDSSYIVHLGSGKFCIARIFNEIYMADDIGDEFAVFTGVEVLGESGQQLKIVKHKSVCYKISPRSVSNVL